jgi:hypothetical protein
MPEHFIESVEVTEEEANHSGNGDVSKRFSDPDLSLVSHPSVGVHASG